MRFCEKENIYDCGIYVTTEAKKEIVMNVIHNLFHDTNKNVIVKDNHCESLVKYPNGNIIMILPANDTARGQRFNGIIIDSNINREVVNTIILPHLIPLKLENGTYSSSDNPRDREYYCSISKSDVVESEKHKRLNYLSPGTRDRLDEYINRMKKLHTINLELFRNHNKFEKEYKIMWNDEYDLPIRTIEKDNSKILVFNALGISKNNIKYKTEFVNKSKESYLVIKGREELIGIDFKNSINIRMRIDTDIYDGYTVRIENGLAIVILHEIENEVPVLKDYGAA